MKQFAVPADRLLDIIKLFAARDGKVRFCATCRHLRCYEEEEPVAYTCMANLDEADPWEEACPLYEPEP